MGRMKKIVRAALMLLSGIVTLTALYILIICYPQWFFRYFICDRNGTGAGAHA
jgi:hypothetical protein